MYDYQLVWQTSVCNKGRSLLLPRVALNSPIFMDGAFYGKLENNDAEGSNQILPFMVYVLPKICQSPMDGSIVVL